MQASKDPLPEESYGTHLFSPTISCDNILNCHIPEKFIKDTVSKVSKGDKSHRHSLSRMHQTSRLPQGNQMFTINRRFLYKEVRNSETH